MDINARKTAAAPLFYVQQEPDKHDASRLTSIAIIGADGLTVPIRIEQLRATLSWACKGYEAETSIELILQETIKNIFDGATATDLAQTLVLASLSSIELDPAYGYVAARLLLKTLYKKVANTSIRHAQADASYRQSFIDALQNGVNHGLLDPRLLEFDVVALSNALLLERDDLFDYMGLKTLYERYFLRIGTDHIELPQAFWMRIAMGLAINEPQKNERAIEFYQLLSTRLYIPGTPTLLHAGLKHAQLASCFLTTVDDDLHHIFKCLGDDAQLSKWSGGISNDWTNIRATGALIKSIRIESQGVIPFLKLVSDVTSAISRSGRRRGAICVYLETWHLDIEDFLDLRRNTGDERRRTHDINTAHWIPDLFMKRVAQDGNWTLFSPHEVPELHDLYGQAFEIKYAAYEEQARQGKLQQHKVVSAKDLWRKMLSRIFETGHPWITFKDPCNIRSPQDHVGVVHCSNLCTEITLNTSAQETAVCNLGSINLARHVVNGILDEKQLAHTVKTAVRMLDNIIDLMFYPTPEAKNANQKHRPIGLGIMGFQDALYKLNINFDTPQALSCTDTTMEFISYHAILASSVLARERGTYASYKGSKWDRGIFPLDTIALLEQERGAPIDLSRDGVLDWTPVRQHVQRWGMRNSNTMAIAPTATISNISGCFPCIEPIFKNIYVKANMSGEFTVVNKYLVDDLKKLGLWDKQMLDLIKYYDGNLAKIERIPVHLRSKYKEAFELDPFWLLKISATRMKWIDQSQSHNIFMQGTSGKTLHDIYFAAWNMGMKTTYYLRTLGASQIEKSTLDAKTFGFTQKRAYNDTEQRDVPQQAQTPASELSPDYTVLAARPTCNIENLECESCQ
jgi:ribonucleoside-diphosphate reductase alpha chain